MHAAVSFRLTVLLALLLFTGSSCSVFGQAPEDEGEPLPDNFDVDGNGEGDFSFIRMSIGNRGAVLTSFSAYARNQNSLVGTDSLGGRLVPLRKGVRIGPILKDSLAWADNLGVYGSSNGKKQGLWIGVGKKYFGFRLGEGDAARYGWALISVDAAEGRSTDNRIVEAILYDYTLGAPGEAIRAGEKP